MVIWDFLCTLFCMTHPVLAHAWGAPKQQQNHLSASTSVASSSAHAHAHPQQEEQQQQQDKQQLDITVIVSQRLDNILGGYVMSWLMVVCPIVLWLRQGFLAYLPGVLVFSAAMVAHFLLEAVVSETQILFHNQQQHTFIQNLVCGRYTYDVAVEAYHCINSTRKVFADTVNTYQNPWFVLWFLGQGILVYDYELKSWGAWPLGFLYMAQTLAAVGWFQPWLELSEWPSQVVQEMMESRDLGWTPTERTNFAALVHSTEVTFKILDLSLGRSFNFALPFVLFNFWLYVTENTQFNDFTGFSFDQSCGARY